MRKDISSSECLGVIFLRMGYYFLESFEYCVGMNNFGPRTCNFHFSVI